MVYEYVLLTFIVTLFRKGSVQSLSKTELYKKPYIFLAIALQFFAIYGSKYWTWVETIYSSMIILSYLLLLIALFYNRAYPGLYLFSAGLFLNFWVILWNGGRMPVSLSAIEYIGFEEYIPDLIEGVTKHEAITQETLFPWFADIIPLTTPFVFLRVVISIGDVLITLGVCRFIYCRMKA